MKVNHHQIKNAIAYFTNQLNKDVPSVQYHLGKAVHTRLGWEFSTFVIPAKGVTQEIHGGNTYRISLDKLGTEENISLENIAMETERVDIAVDLAEAFINDLDNIASASLYYLLDETTQGDIRWRLEYSCRDNRGERFNLSFMINTLSKTILNVVLDYPSDKEASEIAENFVKQSDDILTPQRLSQSYWGRGRNTGVHYIAYKGFNQQGEAIKLELEIDAKHETILSHEIRILKPDG